MSTDTTATARAMIASAAAHAVTCEARAVLLGAAITATYWRTMAERWQWHADQLRAIAARHGLSVE